MDPLLVAALTGGIVAAVVLAAAGVVVALKLSPDRRLQVASVADMVLPSAAEFAAKTENKYDDAIVLGLKEASRLLREHGLKPLSPKEELLVKAHLATGLRAEEAAPSPQ